MQPKTYISYSPGKAGAVFALLYCESGADLYGWHIEARSVYFSAAFFMIENYYARHALKVYRSMQDDVYGPWTVDCPPTGEEIRCPVPDTMSHELERMQSRFVDDWLFFDDDADIGGEKSAYRELRLPLYGVNIKARRLSRLLQHDGQWSYLPPGTDLNVAQVLRKYWRLSEKLPAR